MASILSIGTAVPEFEHPQERILQFMQHAYELNESDKRKLAFLYAKSGIKNRYSVLQDYDRNAGLSSSFCNSETGETLNERMDLFAKFALPLSMAAINNCLQNKADPKEVTHLITVSCTGMSAPGLDLGIMSALKLKPNTFRTSLNFMGCYGAVHGLKLAKLICDATPNSTVLVVATELCTIHFQKEYNADNAASSLLFGDGSAAVLLTNRSNAGARFHLRSFYSHVAEDGANEMSWNISSKGFLMRLSSYVPELIQKDIGSLLEKALEHAGLSREAITHWCFHPGGRKILDVIQQKTGLCQCAMSYSANVLSSFGNMSSPTILFVLKEILQATDRQPANVFGVAFGPGLTMETFIVAAS